ncbi:HIT family protein [Christiangramia forsetii]|uniref:Histidine triad (HIT) family protein n=2 Tax=Christiangramia forsetii TaxID=411153 RepID=A0M5U6_CHRFK|nr:HIT domain-containing protein [Christiangramia forsetii]GGG32142.1 hydrolase [Christiangramia forsetii]CAL67991.1 histidine triad (HIT) family protein [Christiangramia forsetii KT0803]
MSTLFTKIVKGEVASYKVAENSQFLAFLDVRPNVRGHVLCIPKKEVNKIWDLEEEMYQELMRFTRSVSIALEKTVSCKRVGMAVVGLEVPHTHVHLIPLNTMNDMDFSNHVEMSEQEFKDLAEAIHSNLEL